jgi:putative NADPH-quinone reductase
LFNASDDRDPLNLNPSESHLSPTVHREGQFLHSLSTPFALKVSVMNALIVLAHPEPHSFNAHLVSLAEETLRQSGYKVEISDLYAQSFNPCEGPQRYPLLRDRQFFDAQAQQRYSWDRNALPPEVLAEIEKIQRADLVIVQFPLWWFGMPAILKGWMDRAFVYGGLYAGAMTPEPAGGKRSFSL